MVEGGGRVLDAAVGRGNDLLARGRGGPFGARRRERKQVDVHLRRVSGARPPDRSDPSREGNQTIWVGRPSAAVSMTPTR